MKKYVFFHTKTRNSWEIQQFKKQGMQNEKRAQGVVWVWLLRHN
jgi:hypothetical protein